MAIKQQDRTLFLTSSLGPDSLLISSFSGTEAMSQLFNYQLIMEAEEAVDPKDIIGKSISWKVHPKKGQPRYFNGFVSRFATGAQSRRKTHTYRAEVVPWLWFLTRTSNCRIWPGGEEKKTVPQIVKMIFDEMGFSAFEMDGIKDTTYPELAYCVQYRETAFNFVSRILEEEGIFYYFRHENGKHTMVLADQKGVYNAISPPDLAIDNWEHQFELRAGKVAMTDYYFKDPSTSLLASTETLVDLPDAKKYEMFDYPGDYRFKPDGEESIKVRMEEQEIPHDTVRGSSECRDFAPGAKFTLGDLDLPGKAESGQSYVITQVQHSASDVEFEAGTSRADYRNMFSCIPASTVFRAGRVTPKPVVTGVQSAVVVGPEKEEIYTDKYGRVKIQFFWDRRGEKNENSSCWVRVSQGWAGKNWGMVFNPRIGQEVLVEFLEGDPDRPVIIGRVYNAEQMPPYELPLNQTQSGIKSRSSLKGTTENFNEIRFEDKKDKEHIVIHAERNLNIYVENNERRTVGNDQSHTVVHNATLTIGTDSKRTDPRKDGLCTTKIFGDTSTTITKGDLSLDVQEGKMTVHVKGVVEETFDDTLTTTVKNKATLQSASADVLVKAAEKITLECGASSITLKKDGTIEIKGKDIKISGSASVAVDGAKIDSVASAVHTIKGNPVKINC